jgi:predicted lipoprotein with Yx(FWY)xxD motif
MKRLTLVLSLMAAVILVPAAMSAGPGSPVITIHAAKFGNILATRGHLALYTWNKEKDHKVHCTGACAKAWPPILVSKGTRLAMHQQGAMGTFGTIVRPDGKTQVIYNGRPVYTFHGDTATEILCNGVDGWYVIKA